MDFTRGASLPGGKKDEEKLAVLFTGLGFKVKNHQNLTGEEISDTVKSYSAEQHSGAFLLVILSHGTSVNNRPAVIGTDGTPVVINKLESFFYASNCNSLHGKPKIFLIDACRGSQEEKTFNPVSTSGMTTKESSTNLSHHDRVETRSDSADFLIVYAATDGNVAFTTDEGSYLTQAFVEVTTNADETDSLRDIVTRVTKQVQDRNPHQTVESTMRLTRKYLIKRYIVLVQCIFKSLQLVYHFSNTPMVAIQKNQTKFSQQVQQWIPVRDIAIEEIEKTIKKLKKHHKKVNISRITGSSVSIAGSLMAMVGFGLAPVTLGASIGLSVGGIAIAVAGGGTAAGASITDAVLQRSNVKHAQEQLDRDYKRLDEISQIAKEIKKEIDDARERCPSISAHEYAAVFGEVITQGVARGSNVAVRLAELGVYGTLEIGALALRVGGAAARGIAAAEIVLTVVLIPIDIAEIIRSSISLGRGSQTKAIKQLTDIVEQLKEQKEAFEGLIEV